jgi:hypothetical protein
MQNRKTIYAIKAAFWFSVVCGATGWFMFSTFHTPAKAVWLTLAVPFAVLTVQAVLFIWHRLAKDATVRWEYVAFAEAMIGALFLVGAWDLLPGEARFLNLLAVGIWVIPVVFLLGAGHEDLEAVKRIGMGLSPYQAGILAHSGHPNSCYSLFDDSQISHESSCESSDMDTINIATGLPMSGGLGGLDAQGNTYGHGSWLGSDD